MTKIEELEQKLNELEANFKAEFYDLQHELAELKESKKEGKWKPKEGERYYFRDIGGATSSYNWTNSDVDKRIFEHTLTFPTYEQCERYWHFMDTVKEKSYEFSREEVANEDIWKFSICYIPSRNSFVITHNIDCKYLGTFYFKTEEDAQYIIDNFKDELMEYFVEE